MQCSEIMKRNVQTVSPADTILTAARRMRDANVGFLPVVDPDAKVLGTITDRDIAVRAMADAIPTDDPVSRIMTQNVVSCRSSDDIGDAERLMGLHRKSRMICLDEQGKLEGVLSLSDVVYADSGTRAAETLRDVTSREVQPTS